MDCHRARKGKGDHVVVSRQTGHGKITTSVPMHKPLKIGTLKGIIKILELDFDEFLKNLLPERQRL